MKGTLIISALVLLGCGKEKTPEQESLQAYDPFVEKLSGQALGQGTSTTLELKDVIVLPNGSLSYLAEDDLKFSIVVDTTGAGADHFTIVISGHEDEPSPFCSGFLVVDKDRRNVASCIIEPEFYASGIIYRFGVGKGAKSSFRFRNNKLREGLPNSYRDYHLQLVMRDENAVKSLEANRIRTNAERKVRNLERSIKLYQAQRQDLRDQNDSLQASLEQAHAEVDSLREAAEQ